MIVKKILGFSKSAYSRKYIDSLTNVQKNELYLEDSSNAICYDCVQDFFNDLNDMSSLSEKYYFYFIILVYSD